MYYWVRTRSRARARKENGASSVENLKNDTNGAYSYLLSKLPFIPLAFIAVMVAIRILPFS